MRGGCKTLAAGLFLALAGSGVPRYIIVSMRRLLPLVALALFFPCRLFAEWTLVGSTPHPGPDGLEFTQREVANGEARTTLWVVSFNPKTHAFAVMDNPDGAYNLGSASEKRGVLAAVN